MESSPRADARYMGIGLSFFAVDVLLLVLLDARRWMCRGMARDVWNVSSSLNVVVPLIILTNDVLVPFALLTTT